MFRIRRLFGSLFLSSYRLLQRGSAKTFWLLSARGFASFGARSVIQPPVRLGGESRISIGNGVFEAVR